MAWNVDGFNGTSNMFKGISDILIHNKGVNEVAYLGEIYIIAKKDYFGIKTGDLILKKGCKYKSKHYSIKNADETDKFKFIDEQGKEQTFFYPYHKDTFEIVKENHGE